jgi:hypothetical protein
LEIKVFECSFSGILDICLYKHVSSRNMMNTKINSLVMALAVTSMALTPLIMNQNADAASHYCADQKGKPHAWITGCKDGWYDHDNCNSYSPGSGDYAKGYKVGWAKGSC